MLVLNRKVIVTLDSPVEILSNGIEMEATISNGRSLLTGRVMEFDRSLPNLRIGKKVCFPKFAANEASRLGENVVTITYDDIEWVE